MDVEKAGNKSLQIETSDAGHGARVVSIDCIDILLKIHGI